MTDNGEGHGAEADSTTPISFGWDPTPFLCLDPDARAEWEEQIAANELERPVMDGNIQVVNWQRQGRGILLTRRRVRRSVALGGPAAIIFWNGSTLRTLPQIPLSFG